MDALPSVEQVRELPVARSTVVPESYLDENDHMNIARYFEEAGLGLWEVMVGLGFGQAYIDERGLSTFTAEHHITYLSELRQGDRLSVHVRILERGDKAVHAMAFIVDDTHDRLSCVFEAMTVHVDMSTRRPSAFPTDVAQSLDAEVEGAAVQWPAPLCGAIGIRRS